MELDETTKIGDIPLPDKLSELLRLAITDARALDRKKYTPHSGYFHTGLTKDNPYSKPGLKGDTCRVCLAGAVIANTLKVSINRRFQSYLFGGNAEKLYAIDHLRKGELYNAITTLHIDPDSLSKEQLSGVEGIQSLTNRWTPFSLSFHSWEEMDRSLKRMERLATRLEAIDL